MSDVTVTLEVEGEPEKMDELKNRLENSPHVESVEFVDLVSEHELDVIEMAVTRLRNERGGLDEFTPSEVADEAGLPLDKTKTGLAELSVLDDLR
jgi:hypothetical protein